MSVRPSSKRKRTPKESQNKPIFSRYIIHHKSSHQKIDPQKVLFDKSPLKAQQPSIKESLLQRLFKKCSMPNISRQSPKENVSKSLQKERNKEYEDENKIGGLVKNLTTKSPKEIKPTSQYRLKTICSEKLYKQQQKVQQIQIKPQLQQAQPKKVSTIDEVNQKLQYLVTRKLKLVMKETQQGNDMSSSLLKILKKNINRQLLNLIQEIKSIKQSSTRTQLQVLNQKIYFIQTLLAEQNTESQLMKKYYFKLTSNKKRGKVGDFNYFQLNFTNISKQTISPQEQKQKFEKSNQELAKPFFDTSINRQSYKKPKLSDYQCYRYKQKNFTPNLQPLPRSSYRRDFLSYKTSPDEKIVSKDHSPYNPSNKVLIKSVYENDYKRMKTEPIDYKELDAFKNKYKILKVNYMPEKKANITTLEAKSQQNNTQANNQPKTPEILHRRLSQNQKDFNRRIFQSEAHRSFIAEQLFERSQIKHQQLKQFQYHLKRLFKA